MGSHSQKRSVEMITVGFFLSAHGEQRENASPHPPKELRTKSWQQAYAIFFDSLGEDRSLISFSNSLKNTRDAFDSWLDSGRAGWRSPEDPEKPHPLTSEEQRIYDLCIRKSRSELWEAIQAHADLRVSALPPKILKDLESHERSHGKKRTEGGKKVYVSKRSERSPFLRSEALRIHGTACAVCGFDFGRIYGAWGKDFAEVHHLTPLKDYAEGQETDPEADLIVLCANCHRMVHRKSTIALTVEELQEKLDCAQLLTWAQEVGIPPT